MLDRIYVKFESESLCSFRNKIKVSDLSSQSRILSLEISHVGDSLISLKELCVTYRGYLLDWLSDCCLDVSLI